MSVVFSNDNGWVISHLKFFEKMKVKSQPHLSTEITLKHDINAASGHTEGKEDSCFVTLNPDLFEISEPFKTKVNVNGRRVKTCPATILSETTKLVQTITAAILKEAECQQIFQAESNAKSNNDNCHDRTGDEGDHKCTEKTIGGEVDLWPKSNSTAVGTCKSFFDTTLPFTTIPHFHGANPFPDSAVWSALTETSEKVEASIHRYLFLPNTKFYCNDVMNMEKTFQDNNETEFDLILMDPPWWNKCIRRKKRKQQETAYDMMDNEGIGKLPIKRILKEDGLIVVWCTNAKSHHDNLINVLFPKWGITLKDTLYWLKVTKTGVPICPFNAENKKQPYETIFIGSKESHRLNYPPDGPGPQSVLNKSKVIISVPSSINSHKPPLINVIKDLYPHKVLDRKLEIFARYLMPGFVSYGNEVVKLQHESLYVTM